MDDDMDINLELLDRDRLKEKVAWEGGVFETLRYGVRTRHIGDSEIAPLWEELEERYAALAAVANDIERRLAA